MGWEKGQIIEATHKLLETIPSDITVVAAAKQRTIAEVEAVIQAGIQHIGHNYFQEAQKMVPGISKRAVWHMIGHLQRNKAAQAVHYFDMIETLDSFRLANMIENLCAQSGKIFPVLVEVNSGRETNKSGLFPENVEAFIISLSELKHIHIEGLMTMGPLYETPEKLRPYFRITRQLFEHLTSLNLPDVSMTYLSMGMSDSYTIAIEEGANMIRIGTKLFGPRQT